MLRLLAYSWVAAALLGSTPARAEPVAETCTSCFLGVYDDTSMSRTTGTISPFEIKSVYLGIQLGEDVTGLETLTFDATYPDGFTVLDVTPYVPGGDINTIGSTSVRVEWPRCIEGSRLLFRVRLLSLRSVQNTAVQLRNAVLQTCSASGSRTVQIPAGCYVLNPRGASPCATGIQPATWSATKGLYKTGPER
jgi:hypothetical protein